tara:strand:+ start:1253 stop:1765 length:513 start_codon:yes stop_codon:yes gene_type:complete
MIKKYIRFFFVLLLFLNSSQLIASETVTFLDLDAVLNNTQKGKSIVNKLNDLKNLNSSNFKNKSQEIKKKEQELINKKNILSEEEFEKSIISLKKEIEVFNQDNNSNMLKYENLKKKELDKFINEITPLIENYIIENSISLVINQKNIFIGNNKYDITDNIINIVDKNLK